MLEVSSWAAHCLERRAVCQPQLTGNEFFQALKFSYQDDTSYNEDILSGLAIVGTGDPGSRLPKFKST